MNQSFPNRRADNQYEDAVRAAPQVGLEYPAAPELPIGTRSALAAFGCGSGSRRRGLCPIGGSERVGGETRFGCMKGLRSGKDGGVCSGRWERSVEEHQRFAARPMSVRQARRFVAGVLSSPGLDSSEVLLLTSELATNAVLHANSGFVVRIVVEGNVVRVEVINDEPELLLIMKEPTRSGGRGLAIVKTLARDWGAESRQDSKVVWFELATSAPAQAWAGEH
jgi:anti-sigma regulatory factor (Ser/Thr protein kinase)